MRPRPEITISASALIGLALLLLMTEMGWITAFTFSAAIHELSHAAALTLMHCPIHRIFVGFTGAKMITGPLSRRQELLSSLAGPAGSLALTLFSSLLPRVAICAFFHCVINLIPLYPLDGGRALRCILPTQLHQGIQYAVIALLALFAWKLLGLIGILIAIVIVARPVLEKFLAKQRRNGYNRPTIK